MKRDGIAGFLKLAAPLPRLTHGHLWVLRTLRRGVLGRDIMKAGMKAGAEHGALAMTAKTRSETRYDAFFSRGDGRGRRRTAFILNYLAKNRHYSREEVQGKEDPDVQELELRALAALAAHLDLHARGGGVEPILPEVSQRHVLLQLAQHVIHRLTSLHPASPSEECC